MWIVDGEGLLERNTTWNAIANQRMQTIRILSNIPYDTVGEVTKGSVDVEQSLDGVCEVRQEKNLHRECVFGRDGLRAEQHGVKLRIIGRYIIQHDVVIVIIGDIDGGNLRNTHEGI